MPSVTVVPLAPDVWTHTSYKVLPDTGPFDALGNVQQRYPSARVVVPSHGAASGLKLLVHTIELVRAHAP